MIIGWFIADISLGLGVLLATFVIGIELSSLLHRNGGLTRKLTTDAQFVTISSANIQDRDTTEALAGKNTSSNITP